VTGRRRSREATTVGFLNRAVVAAVVLAAFGNLVTLGCVTAWFRLFDPASPFHSAVWLFAGAGVAHLLAGVVVLLAWAWSR
jgi:hypothetical protein